MKILATLNPARATDRATITAFFTLLLACMLPMEAWASVPSSGDGGSLAWAAVKATIFGYYGMIASVLICIAGVWIWMRRGLGEAILIFAAAFGIFLGPALAFNFKKAGEYMAQGV